MTTNTLQSLLEWMGDPDTNVMWGWDAIVALARAPLNQTLASDYQARQGTDRQWPAFSGEVITTAGLFKQAVHGFVLAAPRLSFQGTAINDQRARLQVPVIGGVQIGLRKVVDTWQVVSLAGFDSLQGPWLTLDLHLDQLSATVGEQQHVSLDFQYSDNWQLDFAPTANERAKGGAFFQAQFEEQLTPAQRQFTLALIKPGESPLLRPQSLRLRGQSREAQPAGQDAEGALLVFVCMAGNQEGGNVDSTFRYLIPDDEALDYSATMLLGQHIAGSEVLQPGTLLAACAEMIGSEDFLLTRDASGALQSAVAQSGALTIAPRTATWPTFTFNAQPLTVTIDSPALTFAANSSQPLSINYLADGRVTVEWTTEQQMATTLRFSSSGGADFAPFVMSERLDLHLTASYAPATDDAEYLTLEAWRLYVGTQAKPAAQQASVAFESDMARWAWQAFAGYVGARLVKLFQPVIDSGVRGHLKQGFKIHAAQAEVTEILTLDFGQVLHADTVAAPRDTAVFGRIIPAPDALSVDRFTLQTAVAGLTVNPLIQVCELGEQVELHAGGLSPGLLEWTIRNPVDGQSGRLTVHDNNGRTCTYEATGQLIPGQTYVLDEIEVHDIDGVSRSVHVLVALDLAHLSVSMVADTELPDGQVRFQALVNGMPPQGVQWCLPLGGPGELDVDTGLYTFDNTALQRFVLVMARVEIEAVNMILEGHLLLPLPLGDFPIN